MCKMGAGEMVQKLKTLAPLAEDLGSVPNTDMWWPTPLPRDSYSELHGYQVHPHADKTLIHTIHFQNSVKWLCHDNTKDIWETFPIS